MVTPSQLRQDIYNLLDQVIKTGIPIEVKRKGKVLKISIEEKPKKLDNLKKRKIFNGDPDEIITNNWIEEWNP